jgi:hypothetical protein
MYKERISDTQALRRVYDRRIRVLNKDIPSKRERKKQSQNGLKDKSEVLSNFISDLNASSIIIDIIRLYKKRQRLAGVT